MPPSPLGERDGGNAAPAAIQLPLNDNAAIRSGERCCGWASGLLKSLIARPSWTESTGMLPMSEPNGSTNPAEVDECDMV